MDKQDDETGQNLNDVIQSSNGLTDSRLQIHFTYRLHVKRVTLTLLITT